MKTPRGDDRARAKRPAPKKKVAVRRTGGSRVAGGRASFPALSEQTIELPDGMWERIARKAYELWEERGHREGHDLEDWLEAEATVMEEIHEARE